MQVRVRQETDEQSASAIAQALARNFGEDIEVLPEGEGEPIATATPRATASNGTSGAEEELEPTPREQRLLEQIEEIEQGGPERYVERLDKQGKLFVRDRLELWFGEDGLTFEDGKFAEFDADERLPGDGRPAGHRVRLRAPRT